MGKMRKWVSPSPIAIIVFSDGYIWYLCVYIYTSSFCICHLKTYQNNVYINRFVFTQLAPKVLNGALEVIMLNFI